MKEGDDLLKKVHIFYACMVIVWFLMAVLTFNLYPILRMILVETLGLGRIFTDIFFGVYTLIYLAVVAFTFSAVQEDGKIKFSLKALKRRVWHMGFASLPILLWSLLMFAGYHPEGW